MYQGSEWNVIQTRGPKIVSRPPRAQSPVAWHLHHLLVWVWERPPTEFLRLQTGGSIIIRGGCALCTWYIESNKRNTPTTATLRASAAAAAATHHVIDGQRGAARSWYAALQRNKLHRVHLFVARGHIYAHNLTCGAHAGTLKATEGSCGGRSTM